MIRWISILSCVLAFAGCTNQAVQDMQVGVESLSYPELEAFEQEAIMPVGYAMEMSRGAVGPGKREAKTDGFKSALEAFKAAPLPDGVDKQAQKDAVVTAAEALIEAAGGSDDEFKTAYQNLQSAMQALRNQASE